MLLKSKIVTATPLPLCMCMHACKHSCRCKGREILWGCFFCARSNSWKRYLPLYSTSTAPYTCSCAKYLTFNPGAVVLLSKTVNVSITHVTITAEFRACKSCLFSPCNKDVHQHNLLLSFLFFHDGDLVAAQALPMCTSPRSIV